MKERSFTMFWIFEYPFIFLDPEQSIGHHLDSELSFFPDIGSTPAETQIFLEFLVVVSQATIP